jgi:signal peptidase I
MEINIVEAADKLAANSLVNSFIDTGIYEDIDELYIDEGDVLVFKDDVQKVYDSFYDYYYGVLLSCCEEAEFVNPLEYE